MKTWTVSAVALACGLLLTACGAEREEPFNPPEDDEDNEIREPVAAVNIGEREYTEPSGAWPGVDIATGKRLEVITSADDLQMLVGFYDAALEDVNFDNRKVVMYDSGWTDDGNCEQQILLDQVEAYRITEEDEESVVEVELTYDRQVPDDSAVCEEDQSYRQVRFYSISTRGEIIFTEEVEGLPESNSSRSSGSSSSSSSSNSSSSSL